jgi:glutamyl/glutaminyl-tRNA synthetase
MATSVDAAVLEVEAALDSLAPQLEGLLDFSRLNLHDDSRQEIDFSIAQYRRRQSLLQLALNALVALVGDGYPALDVRQISAQAFSDLAENANTIEAALAQFSATQAATLSLAAASAEPKT